MKLKISILILTGFCLSILFSCENNKASYLKEPNGSATLIFNNGEQLDFETTFITNVTLVDRKFEVGLSNSLNGILIYIIITSNETLKPGPQEGYISVRQIGNSNVIDEEYNSLFNNTSKTGNEDKNTVNIISMKNDSIRGTFSGTIYSETGKKLNLENGIFNIEIENKL